MLSVNKDKGNECEFCKSLVADYYIICYFKCVILLVISFRMKVSVIFLSVTGTQLPFLYPNYVIPFHVFPETCTHCKLNNLTKSAKQLVTKVLKCCRVTI